jgi:dienelactone hydrolase
MTETTATATRLLVEPDDPALDTTLRIRVDGLIPGSVAVIRASQVDGRGRVLVAEAAFVADPSGTVDPGSMAPVTGSYTGVETMGLIWSMRPDGTTRAGPTDPLGPVTTRFELVLDGDPIAATDIARQRVPRGVVREELREDGLVGILYRSAAGDPRPGVVLLGGSEGGLHEVDAALMAAHGFTVLALAYFGMPGVPQHLVSIPLEYFDRAIDWLLAHEALAGDRVGVIGGSRGGEAALLIGSGNGRVGAVVSTVGSGVLTQGIQLDGPLAHVLGHRVPSWTRGGEALPFLPNVVGPDLQAQIDGGTPVDLARAFLPAMEDAARLAELAIPVERIRGPVLLISAGDDRGWPSTRLSEVAVARARAHGRDDVEHVVFPDAGHGIAPPPYGPTTELEGPGPGVTFADGGTPAANAAAREAAWRRSIDFFLRHLTDG